MQRLADGLQVLVGAKADIHLVEVPGVIAVGVAFKQRVEKHTGGPQFLDGLHPVKQAAQAMGLDAVVLQRRTAQPQRIDLIDNGILIPHGGFLPEPAGSGSLFCD